LSKSKSPPAYSLSLGMTEIAATRGIPLLVNGAKKREPLQKSLRREIATEFPASFLWLHPNWSLPSDRADGDGLQTVNCTGQATGCAASAIGAACLALQQHNST
jgi:6-phosphogluconolactonase/glucosamine-6-phosphate isomerase/deaminase